ncbi:ABC transporter permease subunit [Amycolatopsis endophytica]|uniref:NitT/TauT family transport system permease protein n=1 Tax=Amycolatopsis endophytica TaxID=860233 RepID=A0A853B997_9PSEU|nr:ABC transporter permease subunit [Amycolatopsis endophytica]NYI91317.1 NitT/TauT family transport system permease protein [Amycolatopsis endophytica]
MSARRGTAWIPPLVLAAALVVVWAVTAALADSAVYPGPGEAMASLWSDLGDPRFLGSVADTARVLLLSYVAAIAVGAVTGMVLGLSAFWSRAVLPVVYALNSVPKIVLYPVFLLMLGIGDLSRGAFAFVSGVLPMFLIMVEATAGVSRLHLKMSAALGLSRWSLLRRIVVPGVLPSLASGMRLCFGLTLIGLLLAEMFSGSSGLGYELLRNLSLARVENIIGQVVLTGVLALLPTLALQQLESRIRNRYEVAT